MWIFLKEGLLMPAAFPVERVSKSIASKYDLQVRSRSRLHLRLFCEEYMAPRTYSKIQSTPSMDYEYRFYTTRVAFAAGMARAIAEVDYEKFKPEATEPTYHSCLNQIWSVVYRYLSKDRCDVL